MKIILPSILNPLSRRKDRSVKLSFETRELTPEETMGLMALEGSEGWLHFSPNENTVELPPETASVEPKKTPSSRLRSVLYILYTQDVEKGKYVGLFDNYYSEQIEKIIEHIKSKLDD